MRRYYTGQPGTTVGIIVAAPAAATTFTIRNIHCFNTSASSATITLYIVPSGGSPGVTNAIANGWTIAAGQPLQINSFVMETGDTLQALQGTAGAITLHVQGVTTT